MTASALTKVSKASIPKYLHNNCQFKTIRIKQGTIVDFTYGS